MSDDRRWLVGQSKQMVGLQNDDDIFRGSLFCHMLVHFNH
jgi:hypothetical protein